MSFALRMAWRETRASWARLLFFFLCVALGVAAIVVLRSVVQHVRTTLTGEARSLVGADVVIQSPQPLVPDVAARVGSALERAGVTTTTNAIETQTMAAGLEGKGTGNVKLVELRGVEPAYPFYGAITLTTGGVYTHDLVANHGAVVQPELATALGLGMGDTLRMAGQMFTIRGIIARDRVQRSGGVAFGPRVYIDLVDLRATTLLGFGSRASYQRYARVDETRIGPLTEDLRTILRDQVASVRNWQSLEDRIGQNLTIAENYLSLVGFAIVVLGGIGVWSVTRVIVQQKIRSVAILKCLGATSRQVLATYVLQVSWLAGGGSVLGVLLAAIAIWAIPPRVLTPLGVTSVGVTWSAALQGIAVGLLVSLLFALLPLLDVRRVKPLLLLRADTAHTARKRDWRTWTVGLGIGVALMVIAMWQADSLRGGLFVSGGLAVVTAALYAASIGLVRAAAPLTRSPRFAVRHAVVSLGRPGNQTRVILMTVGLGCFFVLGVRALQSNLLAEFTAQLGQNSPDYVLIDVQKDQVESLRAAVEPFVRKAPQLLPLMRSRVTRVEGKRVQLRSVDDVRQYGHGLGREFGLTFRAALEGNERVIGGEFFTSPLTTLHVGPDADGIDTEVSIEKDMHNEAKIDVGDVLQFDIAGVPLRARITSVRSVVWEESQRGGFVFVLRPGPAVDRLPHTYVGFLQVRQDGNAGGALQRALLSSHPNVSVIDISSVLQSIRDVIDNATLGITIVGAVTLAGGILILVGAVAMTKFQKLYETAIYRTLGASTRLVASMVAIEYGLLGLLAGTLGAIGALGLSWVLATYLFDITWRPTPGLLSIGVVLAAVAVGLVGLVASADVLLRKPLQTLRSE